MMNWLTKREAVCACSMLMGGCAQGAEQVVTEDASRDAPSSSSDACREPDDSGIPEAYDCALAAQGSAPLIDDFEDGDLRIEESESRSGVWYVFSDGSDGCTTISSESEDDSQVLHVSAKGFVRYVGFGVSAAWSESRQGTCYYDASSYGGLRFRAKGSGLLGLTSPSRATIPEAQGGDCSGKGESCLDQHVRRFVLTPEWQTFEIPFCALRTEGWGGISQDFSPADMTAWNFVSQSPDFEIFLDDFEFIEKEDVPSCSPSPCPLDTLPLGLVYDPEQTPSQGGTDGLELFTFEQDIEGCSPLLRRYLAYLPSSLDDATHAPVLIVLPGSGADAESMQGFMTNQRFDALADEEGFVVVYGNAAPGPRTTRELINGGAFNWGDEGVDDHAYLRSIINDLSQRNIISGTNSVYLTGLSNGGGMALRAALAAPERYAGVAGVMPFLGWGFTPKIAEPPSRMLLAFSQEDPGVPPNYNAELMLALPEWAESWELFEEDSTLLPDLVTEGQEYEGSHPVALGTRDSRLTQRDYTNTEQSARLRVLEFDRAGHFWPVSYPVESTQLVERFGFRNRDVDMASEIWAFFSEGLQK